MKSLHLMLPLSFCALLALGCGPSGPKTYTASGAVTFDGQPVESGEIIFRAADGAAASWEGKIEGGKYSLQVTAGAKRVEITARRQTASPAAADSGEPAIQFESYIPEQYNEKSTLTAEVSADGDNVFDFNLTP